MPNRRSPSYRVRDLLENLCVELGFCAAGQNPVLFEALMGEGPTSFAAAVLAAEGLNPEVDRPQAESVNKFVAIAFRRWIAEDAI